MGMDVYGKKPTNETGEYFRRNVWGWRPLWECVESVVPDLATKVEYRQSNDGDGLVAEDSIALGKALLTAVEKGEVEKWIDEFRSAQAEIPMEECSICDATGIRTDQIGRDAGQHDRKLDEAVAIVVGREFGWCNGCNGLGKQESIFTSYGVEVECVTEFADFLINSGGFEIC